MDVQVFQHTEYAQLERALARRASTGSRVGDWLRLQREAARLGLLSVGQELTLDQDFPGWRDAATSERCTTAQQGSLREDAAAFFQEQRRLLRVGLLADERRAYLDARVPGWDSEESVA